MNSFSLVAFLGLIACGNGFSISPAARRVEGNLIMRSSTNGDIVSWSKRTAATLTVGAALGGFPLFQGAEIVFAADTPAATVTSTTKATTTVAIPSKTSTTAAPVAKPAPKLPEEIAVETAINKKAADKAKITELQASIKTAKTALNAARVEVNKYAKQVDEVNTKLKNPKIDVDVKKAVVDDKSRLQKLLNEATYSQKAAEKIIDNANKEIDDINEKRLKEDDKVIASKKEDLKKKKEKLAKEAKEAEARKAAAKAKALAEEAARVLKAAQAEDAKAVADVQNAQKAVKALQEKRDGVKKLVGDEVVNSKKIDEKIRSLESALAKAKAEVVAESKKVADLNAKIGVINGDITKAEEVVKGKQAVEKVAAQKVDAAKRNVKK